MYDLFLSPFLPFDFVHQALGEKILNYVAPAGLAQLTAGVAMQWSHLRKDYVFGAFFLSLTNLRLCRCLVHFLLITGTLFHHLVFVSCYPGCFLKIKKRNCIFDNTKMGQCSWQFLVIVSNCELNLNWWFTCFTYIFWHVH